MKRLESFSRTLTSIWRKTDRKDVRRRRVAERIYGHIFKIQKSDSAGTTTPTRPPYSELDATMAAYGHQRCHVDKVILLMVFLVPTMFSKSKMKAQVYNRSL